MHKLILFFFLISLFQISGASTTIQCNNPEYAGKKLDFYQYSDPITKTPEFAFSLKFDEKGKSSVNIKFTNITYVFADFGIYRGMLFTEPNQTISLKLPPFRDKSFADEKNPYFNPIAFWISSIENNYLNDKISEFTQLTNQLTDKYFNQLYIQQSREIFDSVTYVLNTKFSENLPQVFQMHKMLNIKLIEIDVFRLKPEKYSTLFSSISSDYWLQPAFLNLFEKTFGGQLSFQAKSIKGQDVLVAINKSDIPYLLQFVQNKYKVNGKVAELALLKMLYDGFFSGDFSKNAIKSMIKKDQFYNNSNDIIKNAAKLILEKFNHLQQGSKAPVICLNDIDGIKKCTNENIDKFKYLVFADTEMVVCREHLKYLNQIDQRFNKYLEIYIVLNESNITDIKKFMDENKIPGIKLIDLQDKYISKYNIKSFPSCLVLDEKHNIQFKNAKAPLDGFEQQFGPFLQKILFERQRNQSR